MPAYIDKDYILQFLSPADLDVISASTDTNINAAIARAQGIIDFYVSSQVTVPLDTPPEIIKGICADITIYHLHSRTQSDNVPEWVTQKHDDAMRLLKDICQGKGKLHFADPQPEQSTTIKMLGDDLTMSRDMF